MLQKTFNLILANLLIYNSLHFITSLLSPSYRHICHRASRWCVRSVILVGTVRHLAGQGASRRDAGSVSLPWCTIAVVAVLHLLQFSKSFSHTLKILLYLYINIELIFDFRTIYFGTATTATLQQRVQSDVSFRKNSKFF